MLTELKRAAKIVGSVYELARQIGEDPSVMHRWKHVPPRAVPKIVQAQREAVRQLKRKAAAVQIVSAKELRGATPPEEQEKN